MKKVAAIVSTVCAVALTGAHAEQTKEMPNYPQDVVACTDAVSVTSCIEKVVRNSNHWSEIVSQELKWLGHFTRSKRVQTKSPGEYGKVRT